MTPEEMANAIVAEVYRSREIGLDEIADWNTDDQITIGEWKAAIVTVVKSAQSTP